MAQAQEILEILKNSSYKEVFKALFVFERAGDDPAKAQKMLKSESLEELYQFFFDNDYFTGFLNTDDILNEFLTLDDDEVKIQKVTKELNF